MQNSAQFLLLVKHAVAALLQPELAAVREAFVLLSQRQGRVFPLVREALPTSGVFGIKSAQVAALHEHGNLFLNLKHKTDHYEHSG